MRDMGVVAVSRLGMYEGCLQRCPEAAGVQRRLKQMCRVASSSILACLIAMAISLENMAVLRVAPDGVQNFSSVRFAPTYDAVTTRVFPGLEQDDLALSLAGKRNRLSSGDFVRAGVTMGIDAHLARDWVESLCARLSAHLEGLEPDRGRLGRALEIWRQRIETTCD